MPLIRMQRPEITYVTKDTIDWLTRLSGRNFHLLGRAVFRALASAKDTTSPAKGVSRCTQRVLKNICFEKEVPSRRIPARYFFAGVGMVNDRLCVAAGE